MTQIFIVVAAIAITALAREVIRARRSEKLGDETIESLVEDIESRGRMEISLRNEINRLRDEVQKSDETFDAQQSRIRQLNADWTATSAHLAQAKELIVQLEAEIDAKADFIVRLQAQLMEAKKPALTFDQVSEAFSDKVVHAETVD